MRDGDFHLARGAGESLPPDLIRGLRSIATRVRVRW
jgi:hypothetical protein